MTSTHPPGQLSGGWIVGGGVCALQIKGRSNLLFADSYQEGKDKAWETGTKLGRGKVSGGGQHPNGSLTLKGKGVNCGDT